MFRLSHVRAHLRTAYLTSLVLLLPLLVLACGNSGSGGAPGY
jgi:hypothetical protein